MDELVFEALLTEVAYLEKPELYEKMEFLRRGFEKIKLLRKFTFTQNFSFCILVPYSRPKPLGDSG